MFEQKPFSSESLGQRFRGRLVWRVLLYGVVLAIVPMLIMGWASYVRARQLLQSQITGQLSLFEQRQSSNLSEWIHNKETRLGNVVRDPAFVSDVNVVIDWPSSSEENQAARAEALTALDALNPNITTALFNQYFIVDSTGTILAATLREWEGLNVSDAHYFQEHILGQPLNSFTIYSPTPLYTDTPSGEVEGVIITEEIIRLSKKILVFTNAPVTDAQGNVIAHVVGISETFAFQNILQSDLDFLPNASVILFDLEEGHSEAGLAAGVTRLRGLTSLEPSADQLAQVAAGAYQPGQLAAEYNSFDGLPVVGIYEVFPDLNIGLLFEVPQSQVFSELNSLLPFTIVLLVVASTVMAVVIIFGVRSLLNPILAVVNASRLFADGDWQMRARVNRKDEIGLLAESFNQMADELTKLYRSLEFEVSERTQQIIAAAQVAQTATSSRSLEELLSTTVNLIVDRFGLYHAAIFLLDESKEYAVLREATGTAGANLKARNYRIPLGDSSVVTWVARNNAPRLVADISQDQIHMRHELLPETLSEVGVPISIGTEVLGVLDVQANRSDAFKTETMDVMGTLANQLATAIQNYRLLEGTEVDLQQINQLYRASRRIAQASTADEVFNATAQVVQQSAFISAVYVPSGSQLKLVEFTENPASYQSFLPVNLNISGGHALTYLSAGIPLIVRDVNQPATSIHGELLVMPQRVNCSTAAYLPILQGGRLAALIIMASRDRAAISQTALQPYASLVELVTTALDKVVALSATHQRVNELQVLNDFSLAVADETRIEHLYPLIHEQIKTLMGDVHFYIALYNPQTNHIAIPYIYEGAEPLNIDPFPLGEGLTSIVIRTRQPLMLVEDTEQRARALGAKIVGKMALSWLGVPLIASGEVIGVMTVQDTENEGRFDDDDLRLMSTLSSQIAGLINSVRLLGLTAQRALQLRTAAEIARDTSGTLEVDELLAKAINLIRDRFDFYHASVFLVDKAGQNAVVRESTGEAGRQMKERGHSLAVGSKSIVGTVTETGQPLVVNDVTADPTHKFNPLLPDTRSELGIPLKVGERVIGALDVQSVRPFAFHSEDIEIIQILADQLAVAVANAELFSDTQESLAQHRLMHHVTTVAAASATLDEALNSAVQGLRVTLGDRVAILLLDNDKQILRVEASAGYEEEVLGLQVPVGQGITGWVAQRREPLLIKDVTKDPRYVSGSIAVRSEIAVPLIYRNETLGVLNVESDEVAAFDEHDLDILGTLAGSLAAIIVNARLAERQRQLFEVTNKIRRSVSMETILETTASELSRTLGTRNARIRVGSESGKGGATLTEGNGHPTTSNPNEFRPAAMGWTGSLPPLNDINPGEEE
ncbi:MAG: GAF domain-containing protein [Anaerolineae bacterium]|nr:MAG: GAF domain-containing protein [Anaerolineae bacterium]